MGGRTYDDYGSGAQMLSHEDRIELGTEAAVTTEKIQQASTTSTTNTPAATAATTTASTTTATTTTTARSTSTAKTSGMASSTSSTTTIKPMTSASNSSRKDHLPSYTPTISTVIEQVTTEDSLWNMFDSSKISQMLSGRETEVQLEGEEETQDTKVHPEVPHEEILFKGIIQDRQATPETKKEAEIDEGEILEE